MTQDGSTLKPSGVLTASHGAEARVPGLLRLFTAGTAMAVAVPLQNGGLELGRNSPVMQECPDPRMSRRHAQVSFDGRRFWVTDLGSQNGTFVDAQAVPAHTPHPLERVLRLGDSLFVPSVDVRPLERRGVVTGGGFVRGPAMQGLLDEVARAAGLGFTLHLHGESGTGKEGVARAFHERGPRGAGPFVGVNCAAIPQGIAERLLFGAKRGAFSGADADAAGYLQMADGGTLFLDEVVELDLGVQAKLLRALETREVLALGATKPRTVDVNICSASHRDLRALVSAGKLREDLYFRIGRPEVTLPPLRQRPEELVLLLQQEARRMAPGLALHLSLVEACLLRPWPGNVRELLVEVRGALQAALMQESPRVEARHLSASAGTAFGPGAAAPSPAPPPEPVREAPSRARPLEDDEKTRIETALRRNGGNVAATARELGMHRTQLRRLLERHALAAPSEED